MYPTICGGLMGTKHHNPCCTLEACLYWDAKQGGTIHQYRHRLSLEKEYCRKTGAKSWNLKLDEAIIGHCPRFDGDGVTVDTFDNAMGRRFGSIAVEPEWVYIDQGKRKAKITTEFRFGWLIITSIIPFLD